MRGVDYENRVKFETDRLGLDVAHARQQQRCQNLPIRKAVTDFCGDFFQQPFARCVFEEPHQRLDLWQETHHTCGKRRFRSGDSRQE